MAQDSSRGKRMRKLVVYGLVTVVCGAAVGVALAATEATTFSVKQTTRAERLPPA